MAYKKDTNRNSKPVNKSNNYKKKNFKEERATKADIERFNADKRQKNESRGKFVKETIHAICKGMDENGKGVVFYKGNQFHVSNLLPDEEATIEIKQGKFQSDARVISIDKKSPLRIKSKCPVFESCGGCQFQHVSYATQLDIKQEYVKRKFAEIKGNYKIHEIVSCDDFDHYRHKNQVVFGVDAKGKIVSGFYEEDSHKIVNFDGCLIQSMTANKIMATIKSLLPKYRIVPYNEDTHQGFLRHVFIRLGAFSKEVMVVLVVADDMFPGRKDFCKELKKLHPEITTIIQNVNNSDTNMVLGTKERILFGKGYIEDKLCGMTFQISSTSFYQVNPEQTQKLYNKAIEFASLTGKEKVLDAYCGTGTIGLVASNKAKEVIGVELNKEAFKDAIKNSKINNRNNIYFYNADATDFILGMAEDRARMDVVILDPPRSGSTKEFIQAVGKLSPKRVVYVSCNVDTQVRDLHEFKRVGYEVKEVAPFDLFPSTKHVETIALLSKVEPK